MYIIIVNFYLKERHSQEIVLKSLIQGVSIMDPILSTPLEYRISPPMCTVNSTFMELLGLYVNIFIRLNLYLHFLLRLIHLCKTKQTLSSNMFHIFVNYSCAICQNDQTLQLNVWRRINIAKSVCGQAL